MRKSAFFSTWRSRWARTIRTVRAIGHNLAAFHPPKDDVAQRAGPRCRTTGGKAPSRPCWGIAGYARLPGQSEAHPEISTESTTAEFRKISVAPMP